MLNQSDLEMFNYVMTFNFNVPKRNYSEFSLSKLSEVSEIIVDEMMIELQSEAKIENLRYKLAQKNKSWKMSTLRGKTQFVFSSFLAIIRNLSLGFFIAFLVMFVLYLVK